MTDHFVEVPKKVLSPAAEAIFFAADGMQPRQYRGRALGAALRALAVRVKGADAIRQDILDIATELEATNGQA